MKWFYLTVATSMLVVFAAALTPLTAVVAVVNCVLAYYAPSVETEWSPTCADKRAMRAGL